MDKYTNIDFEIIKFHTDDVIVSSCAGDDPTCPSDLGCVDD